MIDSREDQFLRVCIESAKEKDTELYGTAEAKYRNYTDLDKWKRKVFDAIRDRVSARVDSNEFM